MVIVHLTPPNGKFDEIFREIVNSIFALKVISRNFSSEPVLGRLTRFKIFVKSIQDKDVGSDDRGFREECVSQISSNWQFQVYKFII